MYIREGKYESSAHLLVAKQLRLEQPFCQPDALGQIHDLIGCIMGYHRYVTGSYSANSHITTRGLPVVSVVYECISAKC